MLLSLGCDGTVFLFTACMTGCKAGMCMTYGTCNPDQCDTGNNYGQDNNNDCVRKYIRPRVQVLVTLVTDIDDKWVPVTMILDVLT